MLENTYIFELFAQVAATFVGFSLAIGLLQSDSPKAEVRMTMMRAVAELALISGIGSILVLLLNEFGLAGEVMWRTASSMMAVIWITFHQFAVRRMRKSGSSWFVNWRFSLAGPAFAMLGIAIMLFNAIVSTQWIAPLYTLGLFFALVASAFLFIVATFERPDRSIDSN